MCRRINGLNEQARRVAEGCESLLQSFIVVVSAITAIFRARCSLVIAMCAFISISHLQAFQQGKNLGACTKPCS